MRSATLLAALLAALTAAPPAEASHFHRCAGTYVEPSGGLGYTRIRALAVPCRIARSVTRQYTQDLGPAGHPRALVVYDFRERGWRCVRYPRGRRDAHYLLIVCKASGGRRVRFRGYS